MPDEPDRDPASDPDKLKGPGGMKLRQIYEQVQKSVQRDREAQTAHKSPVPKIADKQRALRLAPPAAAPYITHPSLPPAFVRLVAGLFDGKRGQPNVIRS